MAGAPIATLNRNILCHLSPQYHSWILVNDPILNLLVEQARRGYILGKITRQFCIDPGQTLGQTEACEEFVENLRSKCGDCDITWEITPATSPYFANQVILVRWGS